MSTFIELDVTCPSCGDEFPAPVWTAVHAGQNPELRERLLGGELNVIRCQSCGDIFFHNHFILYQDPVAELLVYVYPETQRTQKEELERMMKQSFQEAQATLEPKDRRNYEPLLLFGLESLIELLENEDFLNEESEVAAAICQKHNISVLKLPPFQARLLKLPRHLPVSTKVRSPSREEILKGLDQLLMVDPALEFYANLRATIQVDPEWKL